MTLFGHGKTTQAIAKRFGGCSIYDDSFTGIQKDGRGNFLLPSSEFDPNASTLEITSPGIPPSHPLIQKARNLQSEYDLFKDTMPRSIWISGSNGKTTTTKMTEFLLKGSQAGGNVGLPLADMDTDRALWVLESSSFTLHYTKYAKPDIYLLLPITPDHQSWHGSFAAYEAAKLSPLQRMREGELVLLPRKYDNISTNGYSVYYDNTGDIARYFGIDETKIAFKGGFLLDALMALVTSKVLYDRLDYDKINAFTLDAHRQERVFDRHGRVWINDSKATNVEATLAALQSFAGVKLHLILGGEDKGADLTPLFAALPKSCEIYAIGKNAQKIEEFCVSFDIACHRVQTVHKAIAAIDAVMQQDDVALLSPAAASFDQFASYEDRGQQFKNAIRKI